MFYYEYLLTPKEEVITLAANHLTNNKTSAFGQTSTIKAVAMLSGGLDSRLAVRLIQEQGVEVSALNYITPFCTCTAKSSCRLEAKKAAEAYGIGLKVFYVFDEFIEVIKRPKYGYGSALNPCLDCRILMFSKAKEYMKEIGASFLVTGEVLGERPMSQRAEAMKMIERDSGLSGLIVRPLSAGLLRPSVPEQRGWVDRQKFLKISGRSRKPQIELARCLRVSDYPCAAGGCLLTDKDFAGRMRDLLAQNPHPNRNDIMLLKVGRHCLINGSRVVVGRNEKENWRIRTLARQGDVLMEAKDFLGPLALVRNGASLEIIEHAAKLTARYSKGKKESRLIIQYWPAGESRRKEVLVEQFCG